MCRERIADERGNECTGPVPGRGGKIHNTVDSSSLGAGTTPHAPVFFLIKDEMKPSLKRLPCVRHASFQDKSAKENC